MFTFSSFYVSHFTFSYFRRRHLVVQVGHSQDLSLAKPTLCYGDLLGYYHLTGHADEHHHDEEEDDKDHDDDVDDDDKHRTVKEEEN